MRLLQKTSRAYFLVSLSAFVIAGVVIYVALSFIFKDQLDEKLLTDIENAKHTIERGGNLPNFYPFIEAKEVLGQSETAYETLDTLIFDTGENEKLLYRQLSQLASISGKQYLITARDTFLEEGDLLITIAIVTTSVFILLLFSLLPLLLA